MYLVYRKCSILPEPSASLSSCSWTASLGGCRLSCEADDGEDGGTDEGGGITPRLRTAPEDAAAVVVMSIDRLLVSFTYCERDMRVYDPRGSTLDFRKLITGKVWWVVP